MEHSNSTAAAGLMPPIPRQYHHHLQQQSRRKPTTRVDGRAHEDETRPPTAASPDVLSSLITSLSVISKPANSLFEHQDLSAPRSPADGSFGVDYGAYSPSALGRLREEEVPLDELAASPPVIRTAPPPSGLSPLTAPKSPRSPHRESSGGLRSLLRSSRPSSRGSASSHDDTRSIGGISIEHGLPPSPELRRQRSHDSWRKKSTTRSSKGLLYMSSKERLRASDERKRTSMGVAGANSNGIGGGSTSRADPSLAETSISEEPLSTDLLAIRAMMASESSPTFDSGFPRPIPTRESSLRKTGPSAKRSSQRSTRSKRESESGYKDVIPEHEEHNRTRDASLNKHRQASRQEPTGNPRTRREDALRVEIPNSSRHSTSTSRYSSDSRRDDVQDAANDPDEDGAPFPSVYSGRRRSARSTERRVSGRTTPEPADTLKIKRSSSRLKRLSAATKSGDDEISGASPEPHVGYERPRSADSVDDSVESYLCSPRLSQKIRHPQTGRVISFSEVGDSEGSAVFCCVGMGLTRYIMAFYDELALTLKLRLITPDRPGVGDSEPYTDGTATPLSWPDDVYAICQALKITKFSIMAHSAGAIYALATALRMPQHIRGRIHLLAPWIPPSQMSVFGTSQASPPTNAIPTSQRLLRALPTPFLKAANSSFMSATSSSITSSLPKNNKRAKRKSTSTVPGRRDVTPNFDKENMVHLSPEGEGKTPTATVNMDQIRPGDDALMSSDFNPAQNAVLDAANHALADKERQVTYDSRLTHAIWDLATTGANPAVDLLICLERRHTIGFRYVDITRPVVIHHGSRDNRVPVENVRWLGKAMRRCEVRVLEGEGHGLMASAMVMGGVLMEISKEWEEWNRVTGSGEHRKDGDREKGRSSRAGVR